MQTTEIKRRSHFTQAERIKVLDELSISNLSVTKFAEWIGIHPVTIHQWKRKMSSTNNNTNSNEDVKEILSENEKLKIENENLKKALADMAIDNQIHKAHNQVLKKKYKDQQSKKQKK